jgi:hypothetical protein
MVNAISGIGMVRNYNGDTSFKNMPEYYQQTLLSNSSAPAWNFSSWIPDVVIILLGTNDFSTSLHDGEQFADRDDLKTRFKTEYFNLISKIRVEYPDVKIICAATNLWPDDELIPLVKEIIVEEVADGDDDLSYFLFKNMYGYGCLWHPELATQEQYGHLLAEHITKLLNS